MRKTLYVLFLLIILNFIIVTFTTFLQTILIHSILIIAFSLLLVVATIKHFPEMMGAARFKWLVLLLLIALVPSALLLPFHFIFNILHWEYAKYLGIIAGIFGVIGVIGAGILLFRQHDGYSMFLIMSFLFLHILNLNSFTKQVNAKRYERYMVSSFEIINEGLNADIRKLSDDMAGYEYESLKADTGRYIFKVQQVKNYADNLVEYINSLEREYIGTTDFETDRNGDTIPGNQYETYFSTLYFVKLQNGYELQDSINKSRQVMLNMIGDAEERQSMAASLPLSASDNDIPISSSENKIDWVEYHFTNVPFIASMTILNKLVFDVRRAEKMMMDYFTKKSTTISG